MTESIYHILGLCGEHWHPNVINITAIIITAGLILKSIKTKIKNPV
jgi:hypothetical protein